MEELLLNFDNSFSVSDNNWKKLFKSNGLHQIESLKEVRRKELLEDYKRKRSALVNEKRGLLDDDFNENEEDWMEWSETKRNHSRKWVNHNCKNQLMLSEWLMDYPSDLESDWTCVLCPQGRRSLVVAKMGSTRSYNKAGRLLAKFKSILPNGSPSNRTKSSDKIILDCIWMPSTKQLFALDVLYWKNQELLGCDAQFRLYWLKSKVTELRESVKRTGHAGVLDVFLPPHCLFSQLPATLSDHDPSQVDGILFYHNRAPYISGQTPLVGWLKPFMLLERFAVAVPEQYLSLKPETYTTLEQWVADVSHEHKRNPRKGGQQVDMDCSTGTLESDTSAGVCEDISNSSQDASST